MPEDESNCAKLRSAPAAPSGTPSSKICVPEAPSSNPDSPLSSSAERSSFQVVSNCAPVRTWPNSYSRANLSKMFRLRTNCRADALGSALIGFPCLRVGKSPACRLPTVAGGQAGSQTLLKLTGPNGQCVLITLYVRTD